MTPTNNQELERVYELFQSLEPLSEPDRHDVLRRFVEKRENTQILFDAFFWYLCHHQKTPKEPPSEIREWALLQVNAKEFAAGIKEVQEKGGVELGAVRQKLRDKHQTRIQEAQGKAGRP